MATTTTTLNKGFTIAGPADLPMLDVNDFALVDTVTTENSREAIYQLMAGDQEYPCSLRVGHYKNVKGNGGKGMTNVSAKLTNFAQKADEDDVVWTLPESWVLAKSAPGGAAFYDVEADIESIGALVSVFLHQLAGSITNTNIDELKFAVVNRILEHANTAA